jgi:hypothetical protein
VNTDVYIDLIDSVSGTLLSTPLKIPAGTAANQVLTFTQVRQPGGTWIFKNRTVGTSVLLEPTGPNPQAPTGVAVQMRGRF